MWNRSRVFSRGSFFDIKYVIVYPVVSYVCCISSMCCAYLEFGLLALIAWMGS
jgi:hypothetical protein